MEPKVHARCPAARSICRPHSRQANAVSHPCPTTQLECGIAPTATSAITVAFLRDPCIAFPHVFSSLLLSNDESAVIASLTHFFTCVATLLAQIIVIHRHAFDRRPRCAAACRRAALTPSPLSTPCMSPPDPH